MSSAVTTTGQIVDSSPVRPAVNPWIIAVTVTLATFMELLDTSIANVALPHIAGGLSTGQDESTWVLTSYLVANAVVLPLSAWLSRVFGRKNYYMTCVALFTLSSLACGMAPNLKMLIFFRVLQGIGGGGLAPCEQAILVDTFPAAKRAGAFAVYSIAIVLAPAIGPTLGGWITDSYSWRWIFFINIPIGLVSLFLTSQLVQDPPEFQQEVEEARRGGKLRIDYVGILLIAAGFGCLEVVLDKGQREDWLQSAFIIAFLIVAIGSLAGAIWWELRQPDPVVDLTLLKERNFALANVFYFLFGFTLFGATVLAPQMLQSLFGYTATNAGLALSPGALVIVMMVPFVVRLVPKVGPRALLAFGFGVVAVAMWKYSTFDLDMTFGHAVRARMLLGFGLAFLFVPISAVAYSNLPKNKNNKASSLTNLFRNLGGSFGIAFVTTMLERRSQFHHSVLAAHITVYDPLVSTRLNSMTSALARAGFTLSEAATHARSQLAAIVDQQASLLSFLDCFLLLALPPTGAAVLAFFVRACYELI